MCCFFFVFFSVCYVLFVMLFFLHWCCSFSHVDANVLIMLVSVFFSCGGDVQVP